MRGRKHSPPPPPTPGADASNPHGKFFEKALGAAGDWTRFADPKLLGTLVLLGLGLANLISRAKPLWDAHNAHDFWDWVATGSFVAAVSCASLTVLFATFGLFPRMKPREGAKPSLYYFGGISSFKTRGEYEAAVRGKTETELESEIARQAWEVSKIASSKHLWARRAYWIALLFLVSWVLARVALSFAS
jgi:hypothetical protein